MISSSNKNRIHFIWLLFFLPFLLSEYEIYETKFQKKFENTCLKYEFIRNYEQMMVELLQNTGSQMEERRYFIYVFHENGYSNGGLGDRLGGMITAIAYALRFKRILLIQGDAAFQKLFKPYYFANMDDDLYNWGSWSWSGWKESYFQEMETYHCVNPRPGRTNCALDYDLTSPKLRILKYFGNRAYLCRWLTKPSLHLEADLYRQLNITLQTNLYEVAGCMLRLVMYPTKFLWKTLLTIKRQSFHQHTSRIRGKLLTNVVSQNANSSTVSPQTRIPPIHYQIGVHFRCGDSSFGEKESHQLNPNCVHLPNVTWKGTNFLDDYSPDSPISLSTCAQRKLDEYSLQTSEKNFSSELQAIFLASDNQDSSKQMIQQLRPDVAVIRPATTCHIDLQKSMDCSVSTIVQWFLLSLSDIIVTQSTIKIDPSSGYADSDENKYLIAPYPEQLGPISSFSRYAAVYGLNGEHLYYGNCTTVNTTTLGHSTHGNWICTPKVFF